MAEAAAEPYLSFDESVFSKYHRFCSICKHLLVKPHVLSCLHTFCEQCLINLTYFEKESFRSTDYSLVCPECKKDVTVGLSGISSLFDSSSILDHSLDIRSFDCSSCNIGTTSVFRCQDCSKLLCQNCFRSHNYVICRRHTYRKKSRKCMNHNKILKYYCFKCEVTACIFCLTSKHVGTDHNYDDIRNAEIAVRCEIEKLLSSANDKIHSCNAAISELLQILPKIPFERDNAKQEVKSYFESFTKFTDKCYTDVLEQIDEKYFQAESYINDLLHQVQEFTRRIDDGCKVAKKLLTETDEGNLLDVTKSIPIKCADLDEMPEIGDINSKTEGLSGVVQEVLNDFHQKVSMEQQKPFKYVSKDESSLIQREPKENECSSSVYAPNTSTREGASNVSIPETALTKSNNIASGALPKKRYLGRVEMSVITLSDIGGVGALNAQFNSPQGFCLGVDDEILVADTNNHRVQVFHANGIFKCQFGDGCLCYPHKIAVILSDKRVVVCDRGVARNRFQIFSENGNFLKKIAFYDVGIVASLAATNEGHIVIADCSTPTIYIINEFGNLIRWFSCSAYMTEPSDLVLNGTDIYICDFKAHQVAVFDENGVFQRFMGSKNVTCYPSGIAIVGNYVFVSNSNHNRFNLTRFSRCGNLIDAYLCSNVKISRSRGLRINSGGFILTLSRSNNSVFIVRNLEAMQQLRLSL